MRALCPTYHPSDPRSSLPPDRVSDLDRLMRSTPESVKDLDEQTLYWRHKCDRLHYEEATIKTILAFLRTTSADLADFTPETGQEWMATISRLEELKDKVTTVRDWVQDKVDFLDSISCLRWDSEAVPEDGVKQDKAVPDDDIKQDGAKQDSTDLPVLFPVDLDGPPPWSKN